VKHFVFLSSSHAVATESDDMLTRSTQPRPESLYGQSKRDAEIGLIDALDGTSTTWTILRPPLVYGPENLANFQRLVRLVQTGLPLPLRSVANRRSFVGIDNLVDVILLAIEHPNARGQIFFPSDGEPVSTPALIEAIAEALGRPSPLFRFPEKILRAAAQYLRVTPLQKLLSSLWVDAAPLETELGWTPRRTLAEGLAQLHLSKK
jgi:nucleoside-diphosphate-sugar epimerase